jgi:hypothetical protein
VVLCSRTRAVCCPKLFYLQQLHGRDATLRLKVYRSDVETSQLKSTPIVTSSFFVRTAVCLPACLPVCLSVCLSQTRSQTLKFCASRRGVFATAQTSRPLPITTFNSLRSSSTIFPAVVIICRPDRSPSTGPVTDRAATALLSTVKYDS